MTAQLKRAILLVFGAALIIAFTMAFRVKHDPAARAVYVTGGEVQAVHAEVRAAGKDVRGVVRFGSGDRIDTSGDGRARVRLDDGTSFVVDRSTSLVATAGSITLEAGRIFVQGAQSGRAQVISDGVTVLVGTSTLAVERTGGVRFYCVSGEAVARAFGRESRIHIGETASVVGGALVVAPEKAWNDWTSGMAHPWSTTGKPRTSIGALFWNEATPLAVRSHDVAVTLVGEVATTETRTTYFNAASTVVTGDFRMALPPGALVSGFAVGSGERLAAAEVRLSSETEGDTEAAKLEWAGEGWVRGRLPPIPSGQTVTVVVRYVEWLSPSGGRISYRYPMLAEGTPPLIGEFHASLDISGVEAAAVGIGQDMKLSGDTIEVRRADFRPTADLVVDLQLRPGSVDPARAYWLPDEAGAYLLVRSEVAPPAAPAGITLALLVDTSRSIEPSSLDAERAVVDALLGGLGPLDRVVVLAGDDTARPVGPAELGPVDEDRRAKIHDALAELRPGGATDIGAALERAADALPADAPSAMLMYLGDGWPTLGDVDVDGIRARLSRRRGGPPRLGAVAVGPMSNRFGLMALVRGEGPVFAVEDRSAAAEVAVHLLAEALKPSVAGVELDLGPEVERVYPRGPRTLRSGDTLTTIARVRHGRPDTARLRYRDAGAERLEQHALSMLPVVDYGDVRRRWSEARVLELMLRRGGREAVVDAALDNGLLTPWTGWVVGVPAHASFRATPLWARVLDAGLDGNLAVFSAGFTTPRPLSGALGAPGDQPWPKPDVATRGDALQSAASKSTRQALDDATGSVRQCRESRAALRPEVGGALRVDLSLGGDGVVRDVSVRGSTSFDDDAALDRCVELVIRNLRFATFPDAPRVTVVYEFHLAPAREGVARPCSATSSLPIAMRRGVWYERMQRADSDQNPRGAHGERAYFRAKATCELPGWTDRRTFLELLLSMVTDGAARVELARALDEGGDADAGALVRREATRRAQSPEELEAVRRALLVNEPDVVPPFVAAYAKAADNQARLEVTQTFLRLAPHNARLRRRELALLEALGRKDEVFAASVAVRQEPFLDALLLADTASTLRRTGLPDEARRTFGELAERAPGIPFARAFLGDRLLDEQLYDEAMTAYDALLRLVPDDPAASFRLALAHAGAGRLDIASRMLARVAATGGRTSDPRLQELASMTAAVLVAEARERHIAGEEQRLRQRAEEIAAPDSAGLLLVRAPTWVPGLEVTVSRGKNGEGGDTATPLKAPSLGLVGMRLERREGALRIRVRRQADLAPARAATARLEMLLSEGQAEGARLVSKDVPLRVDGEVTEVVWDGGAFR